MPPTSPKKAKITPPETPEMAVFQPEKGQKQFPLKTCVQMVSRVPGRSFREVVDFIHDGLLRAAAAVSASYRTRVSGGMAPGTRGAHCAPSE